MPIYAYTALNTQGQEQQSQIETANSSDAVRILREQKIFVLQIVEGEADLLSGRISMGRFRKLISILSPGQYLPVSNGDLVLYFHQISLMLRSGHPVVAALDASKDMVSKRALRMATGRMSERIRRGKSFSAVLAEEKKIFAPIVAKLIASGEQSGNLDSILDRVAMSLERSKDLKRQLLSAMAYPGIVLFFAIGVVIFLVAGVIPKFAIFLTSRRVSLPASTQLLLDISGWFQDWGVQLSIVLGVALFATLASYTTAMGKRIIDRIMLYIPLVGRAISHAAMAQAGWTLAMLLKSGVTILQALQVTSGVTGNRIIADCFDHAASQLLEGKNLSRAFGQAHIPILMQHMAVVGESSGQLDVVMNDVGEYYQKELAALVKLLTVMIEPALILGVGGMVGFVYYSFFQAVMAVSTRGM